VTIHFTLTGTINSQIQWSEYFRRQIYPGKLRTIQIIVQIMDGIEFIMVFRFSRDDPGMTLQIRGLGAIFTGVFLAERSGARRLRRLGKIE
jgi:hypothetical protein